MTQTWFEAYKSKLIKPEELSVRMQVLRKSKKTVATLNGSFDLLHAGHLHIIYEASKQGDILIVALNSDHSIKKYKSPHRPIISLESRLQMMAALEFVSFVTWFEETNPCRLLDVIKPNVHVNGADYGIHCIEAQTVIENGGRIHIVEMLPSLSSTEVIKKIRCLPIEGQ